jgi:hypothetical protein
MPWNTPVVIVIMWLILGGTAFAQKHTIQPVGFFGFGEDREQPRQTFSGAVDKVEDAYVLIAGEDQVLQLEVDEEQLIENFVLGQEVEVKGTLEENTITVAAIYRPGHEPELHRIEDEERPQQKDTEQTNGFLGIGTKKQEQFQTFTGVVNRIDGGFVLAVDNRAFLLDIDDEQLVANIVRGLEVEVMGTMEENTIRADKITRAE